MQRISFPVTASKHPYQCLPHYTNSILFLSNGVSSSILQDILSMSCQVYARIFQMVLLSYLLACLSCTT